MSQITYEDFNGRTTNIRVLLDGKVVGNIKAAAGGAYRYWPKGSKKGGESFPSITAVQRSLRDPAA